MSDVKADAKAIFLEALERQVEAESGRVLAEEHARRLDVLRAARREDARSVACAWAARHERLDGPWPARPCRAPA